MSRYAWLACEETNQVICLGKIVTPEDTGVTYFHRGDETIPPISEDPRMTKAIMKFLAETMGKTIRVWPEEVADLKFNDETIAIDGDSENDIRLDKYIEGFPG